MAGLKKSWHNGGDDLQLVSGSCEIQTPLLSLSDKERDDHTRFLHLVPLYTVKAQSHSQYVGYLGYLGG